MVALLVADVLERKQGDSQRKATYDCDLQNPRAEKALA
jgi:hypothetical protein